MATHPDISVRDFGLLAFNGVEAAGQIRASVPGVEVLIFTIPDRALVHRA